MNIHNIKLYLRNNIFLQKKIMRFILAFLFCSAALFSQNKLQSGPMVGYCEMKEAVIWLQTEKPSIVYVAYYAVDNVGEVFKSENYNTTKDNAFTCHVVLDKLQPGKKYNYEVYLDNKKIILPYETSFSSKKLWQFREKAPDFTVALGSCAYISEEALDRPGKPYGSNYSIFESIAKKNPDIMIWGGDNIYLREADWDSKTGIQHRHTHSRKIKEMQALLAKTQNFAIWDDHDFGPNDGDRGFYNKNLTQQAFKDFWANKSYGMNPNQNEGIYSCFNWGDAEVFLLDNRFFRSPNDRLTGEKVLLGASQIQWLIDALVSSKASFKMSKFKTYILLLLTVVFTVIPTYALQDEHHEENDEHATQEKWGNKLLLSILQPSQKKITSQHKHTEVALLG